MIKVNINITLSKIMAYLVLIVGTIFAYIFQDMTTLISTFAAATTLLGIKTYTASRERIKQMEYENGDGPNI